METQNVPDIIDSAVIGRPSPFIHSLSVSQSLILRYNSYAKKLNFKMGNNCEQTFCQRRYISGQKKYGKIFTIICH